MKKITILFALLFGAFIMNGQTTVSYDFSASGAVSGLDEAIPGISLDSNIGFGSFKNSGTANPVINAGQLRLYQNATKGGSIIIYANNNVTITSLVVHASGTTGPAGYLVDSNSNVTTLSASNSYTIQGISASDKIEFFQRDGNSSNRIYVDSFDVTYITSSGNAAPSITNITATPASPTSSDNVIITADVTDADGLASVELDYGTVSGTLSNTLPMTITTGDIYTATIPAQADGTTVYYTISATDNNSSPETATTTEASYDVVDPLPAPTLIISEVVDPNVSGGAGKYIEIYNNGSSTIDFGTTSVYAAKQSNGGSFSSTQLTGTIAPGEFYVVGNAADLNTAYGITANHNYGSINGNGDDGYFLYVGGNHTTGTLFDAYGVVDVDGTGEPWEYTDSRAVRNDLSVSPTATWIASQWTITGATTSDATPGAGESTTYTYDNGAWSPANPVGNSTAADDVVVLTGSPAFSGDLTINNITVQGGTLDLNSRTITVHGDINGTVMVNADGASLVFAGTMAQTMDIDGAIVLEDLTINNTAGVTLTDTNITIKGILNLTAGTLTQNAGLLFAYDSNNDTAGVVGEVGSGTISGLVNVENYYPAQRAFRFMAPSVDMDGTIYENWQSNGAIGGAIGFAITGGTIANGFDQSSTNNPSMFTFSNDGNQAWNAVTSTNNAATDSPTAGTPYRVMVRGDRTVSLTTANATATATTVNTTGTLKTGDVVKTYANTLASDEFVFVGNPYQARVDVGAVLADGAAVGFKNAMYVWNPQAGSRGAYRLYNYDNSSTTPADSEVDGIIQPGQAFFLEVEQPGTAVAPTITFKESHKVAGNAMNATYSLPQAQVVMNLFKANETSARDGFRIQMDGNYNAAIDANDYTKLYNIDENIAIATAAQSLIFEQRLMAQDGEVINLEISNFETGSYTMDFSLNGLGYINTYLHDAFTNDYITLSNGNQAVTVVFDASQPASMDAARFSLVFSNTTLSMSDDAFAKAVTLYPNPTNDGLFYIAGIQQVEAVAVVVINTLGQELRGVSPEVMDGAIAVNLSAAPSGVYFVVIKEGRNNVIRRIIKQ